MSSRTNDSPLPSTDDKRAPMSGQRSWPAPRIDTPALNTMDAKPFNSRVLTYDPLLDWTAYGLDGDSGMEIPPRHEYLEQQDSPFAHVVETPDAMPELFKVESDMQAPELFGNGKCVINEQYDYHQNSYYDTTASWLSLPVSSPSLPPIARYGRPHSEVEIARDNDIDSRPPKRGAFKMEVHKRGALSMEDHGTHRIANDSTQQVVQSRSSITAKTMRGGSSRKARMNKVERQAPPLKSSGLYFESLAEARQVVRGLNWPPRLDETLPKTQEEREHIVSELFNAMQDMSDVRDKKSGHMFQNRWLKGVAGGAIKDENANIDDTQETQNIASDAVYKPWEKERICWEIVATAERIYREGTHFVSVLDPVKVQDCERSRHLTFRERINILVRVLRMYKARVDKLMRGSVVEEYVLCPGTLLKISIANRDQNDVRGDYIVAGRKLKGRPGKPAIRRGGHTIPTPRIDCKRSRNDDEDEVTLEKPQTKRNRKN